VLAPYRSDMAFISNMYVANGVYANAGHGYEGRSLLNAGSADGMSFDRFLASRLGASDRFTSLSFVAGADVRGASAESFDGTGKPYPPISNPVDGWEKLFTSGLPGSGVDTRALMAQDRSLLDFLTADIARMNARLAGPEKEKLDRYLDTVRQTESRLAVTISAPAMSCAPPTKPPETLRKLDNIYGPKPNGAPSADAMIDIVSTALACGISKVGVVGIVGDMDFTSLGSPEPDYHEAVHHSLPVVATVHSWRMKMVARSVAKFRALGLGDSALVAYTDPNGTIHHDSDGNSFMVLVGRMGGALNGMGRAYRFIKHKQASDPKLPGAPAARTIGDLYTTIANAMGVAVDKYGPESQGPLSFLRG
jgi:hypothetical protein